MATSKDSFIQLHIGVDSVDSPFGGCTTHFVFRVTKELIRKFRVRFLDYPNLIRLNPAIPFKTRGNGAVSLHLLVRRDDLQRIIDYLTNEVIKYLIEFSGDYRKVGLAYLIGNDVPYEVRELFLKALTDYVHTDYLLSVINALGDKLLFPLGISRGTVGALASLASTYEVVSDCTYELLVYREPPYTKERVVDTDLLWRIDRLFSKYLFTTFDRGSRKLLATPHGPDPVLLGIRSDDDSVLATIADLLTKYLSGINGCLIFRTNQGTDQHLVSRDLSEFKLYQTGCISGVVSAKPTSLAGGDVLTEVTSEGRALKVVAFRETELSKVLTKLVIGDEITVCGTMKYWEGIGNVLHIEKIIIRKLIREKEVNPLCPRCGHRMKSAGRNKGFKCPKCGYKARLSKVKVRINRDIEEGTYVPPNKSIKHLNKPRVRYVRTSKCVIKEPQKFLWIPQNSH